MVQVGSACREVAPRLQQWLQTRTLLQSRRPMKGTRGSKMSRQNLAAQALKGSSGWLQLHLGHPSRLSKVYLLGSVCVCCLSCESASKIS